MQSNSQSAEQPSRILHTMIRVNDLERSVFFYRDALSMIEMRREDYPEGQFTLSFLGYGNETQGAVLELTYNYGESEYARGTGFGHIAVSVADIYAACERLAAKGVTIIRPPGPLAHIATNGQRDIIAFVSDPDGYRIELISTEEL
jgi:lactoylglutathione lyase